MTGKKEAPAAQDAAPETGGPNPDQVADFLRGNPDFLVQHPDVLATMTPPARWSGDGVVDMQEYMLGRLRTEVDDLRACAQDVIETGRSNMSIQTRTHAAILTLLAATDFDQVMRMVTDELPLLLDVDVVTIAFEPTPAPAPGLIADGVGQLAEGTVDALLGAEQDVLLAKEMTDDGSIFGSGAGLVRSAALARLRPGQTTPAGLLALGSREAALFHPGQGTELIGFLARVLERCIHGWQEKPA